MVGLALQLRARCQKEPPMVESEDKSEDANKYCKSLVRQQDNCTSRNGRLPGSIW